MPEPRDGGPASEKSLRDEFAGQAMNAWFSEPNMSWGLEGRDDAAESCYAVADAMLAERAKRLADAEGE